MLGVSLLVLHERLTTRLAANIAVFAQVTVGMTFRWRADKTREACNVC